MKVLERVAILGKTLESLKEREIRITAVYKKTPTAGAFPPLSPSPGSSRPKAAFYPSKMEVMLQIAVSSTAIPSLPFPNRCSNPSIFQKQRDKGLQLLYSPSSSRLNAVKGSSSSSGFLSAIGKAIEEEEEYRRARAQVHKKGVDIDGYSVEGISIGGHETCVIVPQLKSAFDIGRCPTRAVHQNFLFITHAHLDHIVSPSPALKPSLFSPFPAREVYQSRESLIGGMHLWNTLLTC